MTTIAEQYALLQTLRAELAEKTERVLTVRTELEARVTRRHLSRLDRLKGQDGYLAALLRLIDEETGLEFGQPVNQRLDAELAAMGPFTAYGYDPETGMRVVAVDLRAKLNDEDEQAWSDLVNQLTPIIAAYGGKAKIYFTRPDLSMGGVTSLHCENGLYRMVEVVHSFEREHHSSTNLLAVLHRIRASFRRIRRFG